MAKEIESLNKLPMNSKEGSLYKVLDTGEYYRFLHGTFKLEPWNIITGETYQITGRGTVFICENCTYDKGDTFTYENVKYEILGIEIMGIRSKPDKVGLLVRKVPKEIIEYFSEEETPENIKSITTIHELTANEILDQYKDYLDPTAEEMLLGHISRNLVLDREYKAKGTWQNALRYAENMSKEKQILEALILKI